MSPLKDFNGEIIEMLSGMQLSLPWEQLLPVFCACVAGSAVVIQILLQITLGRRDDEAAREGTHSKESREESAV